MNKIFKRIGSALLAALMVLVLRIPSLAVDDLTTDEVVFTNKAIETKGLAVTKEVSSASESYQAPADAVFTFILNVNDRFAPNEPYTLYNATGKEVKCYYDPAEGEYHSLTEQEYNAMHVSWAETTHTTQSDGSFTLLNGWTAVFTELYINDRYSVEEVDIPANFDQIEPANGAAATGTISEGGNNVTFRNRYTHPGSDVPATVPLTIAKAVSVPVGFELPGQDQPFTFRVTISGRPCPGRIYLVYDRSTGLLIDSSGIVDENSCLTICGGQYAVLDGVPAYANYTVTELPAEGWWAETDEDRSGNVGSNGAEEVFINRNASFGVKKTMSDGTDPDVRFTFLLSHQDGMAWEGAAYYVYDAAGKCLNAEPLTTDLYGRFFLQAGQTALFVGIAPGTEYHVQEAVTEGYVQNYPETAEGYRGQKVAEGSPEVLQFANATDNHPGALTVTKNVVSETGAVDPTLEFWFLLTQRSGEPVANAYFTIGSDDHTTDENGLFCLTSGQTAVFARMRADRRYTVTELGLKTQDGYTLEDYAPKEGVVQTGMLYEEGLDFVFTNNYKSFVNLTLVKVSLQDNSKRLPGATFRLEKLPDDDNVDPDFPVMELTTDENGELTFENLWSGRYSLTETQAPEEYVPYAERIILDVSCRDMTVTRYDKPDGQNVIDLAQNEPMIVENIHAPALPSTGGPGAVPILILGGLLMLAAVVLGLACKKYS